MDGLPDTPTHTSTGSLTHTHTHTRSQSGVKAIHVKEYLLIPNVNITRSAIPCFIPIVHRINHNVTGCNPFRKPNLIMWAY